MRSSELRGTKVILLFPHLRLEEAIWLVGKEDNDMTAFEGIVSSNELCDTESITWKPQPQQEKVQFNHLPPISAIHPSANRNKPSVYMLQTRTIVHYNPRVCVPEPAIRMPPQIQSSRALVLRRT